MYAPTAAARRFIRGRAAAGRGGQAAVSSRAGASSFGMTSASAANKVGMSVPARSASAFRSCSNPAVRCRRAAKLQVSITPAGFAERQHHGGEAWIRTRM